MDVSRAASIQAATLLRNAQEPFEVQLVGRSMAATIGPGATIRIDPADPVGSQDVVAFTSGDHIVAHRIIYQGRSRRASDYFLTRGDSHVIPDSPVARNGVIGKVVAHRRGDEWCEISAPARNDCFRRSVAGLFAVVVAAGLEIHPAIAAWLVRLLLRCRYAAWRVTRR